MYSLSLFFMTLNSVTASQAGLYTSLSSDLVQLSSDAHQVVNYVVDVDPATGDLIVGGLVSYGSLFSSFVYYVSS